MSVTFTDIGRRAGVLLHPTSLPGGPGNGDLGPGARRFVDWMADAGFRVWQCLPIGPTHEDRSPYQAYSVHAGNPMLVSLEGLVEDGLLDARPPVEAADAVEFRIQRLDEAWERFERSGAPELRREFEAFVAAQAGWLEDYALYRALKREHQQAPWWRWPEALRDRRPEALEDARARLASGVSRLRFRQFMFFRQWSRLRRYASERGVLLFGDIPIFVAHDSADVWARRDLFKLDPQGHPTVVAGVPPDYFSATGQRWGNPVYRWDRLAEQHFGWWLDRLRTQLALFDLVRIDHFRGFEAYWEIPAHAPTAREGYWVKAPGEALFDALQKALGAMPLVAEDLGFITPEVHALRRRFGWPGMKILQFAFDGGADNPYLPHNHEANSVVYTGTHDNQTSLGWFAALEARARERVVAYLGHPREAMPWPLVRAAMASVAQLAVVPLQDVLELDDRHRMNTPGTTKGNWGWRFDWKQVPDDLAARLRGMLSQYGRI